jgi:arginyl-tRNA synthetase
MLYHISMIKSQLEKILGFEIEATENPDFGDYSSNIALSHKNPREFAEKEVEKLKADKKLAEYVDKIEIAGPGFINFWLTRTVLVSELEKIQKDGEKYGKSDLGKGKTVIIDYSSPNIAKPFGIGHLRSTIIGQALYNLYTALGYTVVGDNHLGDWGTQFGKLLYMIKSKNVTDYDITKLEELYVEFHKLAEKDESLEGKAREWFKKLEEGDSEAKSIWQKCVDVSIKEFNKVYELLGVNIDFAFGESYYESEMKQMMEDSFVKKHIVKGEDGALIIDLTREGITTPLMFLKSDGATTYATRDLATIKYRERKWDPTIIIYEVGAEQTLHFKQVFAAAKLIGLIKKPVELVHTAHGLYLASDGKKFSTRKGKTIKLEEVLDEAIKRAMKLQKDNDGPASALATARQVGIGAIKYFDLMHSVQSNVIFEWEKIMNMEGNSGPYLQYTVARTNSVLAKVTFKGGSFKGEYSNLNEEELLVIRSLAKFPEIVESAALLYSPNLLCNFLYELASKYNGFYNKDKIIGSDNEDFRLALTYAVGQVLKNGLKLLGISTPERM